MTQSGRQTAHSDDKHDSYLQAVESDPDIAISAVAADLVRARTHLGLDIETVAEDLRIRKDHLLAIEGGRFDTLPGPVYVVGFLRSYANYLGLDADDIITRFKTESMGFEVPQKLHFPVVPEAGRLPRVPLLIAALVMAGLGYVGWYYVTSSEGDLAGLIPEVPGRLADLVSASDDDATGAPPEDVEAPAEPEPEQATVEPEPATVEPEPATVEAVSTAPESPTPSATAGTTASGGEPASAGTETVSPDIVTVEPLAAPSAEPEITVAVGTQATDPGNGVDSAPDESGALSETTPAETTPAVASEPTVSPGSSTPLEDDGNDAASAEAGETDVAALVVPPPPEVSTDYVPRVFGQANSGSRILVKARLESWVQVTGANNELLITRILRPGDVYHVPDREGLFLMTGNAGGIDLLVDGALAPSLGPVNAIRRDVALVPDRLASGTAVP